MYMEKQLTKSELKEALKNTLFRIDQFCKAHNISYYLAYGTALGAVRHKGLIPWDDDIDIFMFRDDYQKFEKLWLEYEKNNSNDHYTLWGEMRENNYFCGYWAKFWDTNTHLIEHFSGKNEAHYGVFVDIFVLDDIPEKISDQIKVLEGVKVYSKMIRHFSKHAKKWNQFVNKLNLPLPSIYTMINKVDQIKSSNKNPDCKFVANYSDYYVGREKCVFPKYYFEKSEEIEFEGRMVSIMGEWDAFLNQMYGNYMELPPVEQRVGHNVEVYWTTKGE